MNTWEVRCQWQSVGVCSSQVGVLQFQPWFLGSTISTVPERSTLDSLFDIPKHKIHTSQYIKRVFKGSSTQNITCHVNETTTYLNTEVSSIYVVTEEEIPRVTG